MTVASTTMKNFLCDQYAAKGLFLSLHTGSPGANGANEAAGGGYARQPAAWGASAGGVISAGEVTWGTTGSPLPAGAYSHWGLWSAVNGGTYLDGGALTSTVTLSAPAQVKAPISYTQT